LEVSHTYIVQKELARRWSMSPRTLERWRWLGLGPTHHKVGGRVLYRLDVIEAYEEASARSSTSTLSEKAGVRHG
jgi:hypothetical protein